MVTRPENEHDIGKSPFSNRKCIFKWVFSNVMLVFRGVSQNHKDDSFHCVELNCANLCFSRGKPFRCFKKWLEEQPPYDIVIDGANVTRLAF